MLAILHPNTALDSEEYRQTMHYLENLPNVSVRVHEVQGATQRLTEIYLLGDTKPLNKEEIEALPAVERAIRISDDYRILGRHRDDRRQSGFTYNGVEFSQSNLNIFAGLCAVDGTRSRGEYFRLNSFCRFTTFKTSSRCPIPDSFIHGTR